MDEGVSLQGPRIRASSRRVAESARGKKPKTSVSKVSMLSQSCTAAATNISAFTLRRAARASEVTPPEDPKPDRSDQRSGFEEETIRNSFNATETKAKARVLAHL